MNIAEQLVNSSADVNAQNKVGLAPLHFAAARGHANIIEYLVNKSANVNVTSKIGQTPLFWAALKGYYNKFRFDRPLEGVSSQNAKQIFQVVIKQLNC